MKILVAKILLGLVKLYIYVLSPIIPRACRFMPTCSEYAVEAMKMHGPGRGVWLTARRLLRCHPWGGAGYDPVPQKEDTVYKRSDSPNKDRCCR